MQTPLRSLDPIITTAYAIRNYGYMVYDTLLSRTAAGKITPQMLASWEVSKDGKSYVFTLRDGLLWHDGAKVTSADCIPSIKRWAVNDKMGQILMNVVTSLKALDDQRFEMVLNVATDLPLRALSKPSGVPAFMMPERVANTSPTKAITTAIGSGPFKFLMDKFRPGVESTFVKNGDYVPRSEPSDGFAGSHAVHLDTVHWVEMPEFVTQNNALNRGEVDYIEQADHELLPLIDKNPNIEILVVKAQGYENLMRLNWVLPPFNDKLIRQAAMAAVDQKQILEAQIGNPKYDEICDSMFVCGTTYASSVGSAHLVKGDPERSKSLLKQAGYDGSPVVILRPSDNPTGGGLFVPIIAQQLEQGGFKVQVQTIDWQTELTRRASMKPVSEGGWNIITTGIGQSEAQDPLSNWSLPANGKGAWFGWPDVPEIEKLRMKFALSNDADESKKLAVELQKLAMEDVVIIPIGQFSVVTAIRRALKDYKTDTAAPVFWGVKKVAA